MMNSPVSCLPDPIQNMAPVKKKNNKKNTNPPARPMRTGGNMAPAAMGGITSKGASSLPVFAGVGRKMVVQNYELITTYKTNSTDTFASLLLGFTCNPGIVAFTPWLATIALNYSKFKWKSLRFIYVPSVPTSIPGSAYINMSYDPSDTPPASLADVAVSDSSSIGPVWVGGGINSEKAFRPNLGIDEAIFVDVDCKTLTQPYYYVRKQAGLDADSKPLVVYCGTQGALNGASNYGGTGQLYVAYTVELFEPVASTLNS
jgi:hypothetical protein